MLSNLKMRWLAATIVLDISLTVIALWVAYFLRLIFPSGVYVDENFAFSALDAPIELPGLIVPFVIAVWLIVFSSLSMYDAKFIVTQYNRVHPLVVAVTGAILVLAGVAYFFFPELSRFLFLYFYLLDLAFLIGWRKIAAYALRKKRVQNWQPHFRIAVVGEGELADTVATAIKNFSWSGLRYVGQINGSPQALGSPGEMTDLIAEHRIDEIIFALPPEDRNLLQELVIQLQPLPVSLRLVPDVIDLVFVRATIEDFAGLPLIGLREPAISVFDRLVKRTFDIVASGTLLFLTSPLTLITTALIKLDSDGDVLYTSQRVGEGGKIFKMYKFRTMVQDADQGEMEMLLDQEEGVSISKSPGDPRVTRVGRFLRRTSLDELPQLVNVLRGDMSLVGPRPELPWLVKRYEPWQYQRFTVPQGMTGWWQVKHRGLQNLYDVRIEDDLYYIHNYSFLLDLRILWLTMGAIIRGDGAY